MMCEIFPPEFYFPSPQPLMRRVISWRLCCFFTISTLSCFVCSGCLFMSGGSSAARICVCVRWSARDEDNPLLVSSCGVALSRANPSSFSSPCCLPSYPQCHLLLPSELHGDARVSACWLLCHHWAKRFWSQTNTGASGEISGSLWSPRFWCWLLDYLLKSLVVTLYIV